MKEEFEHLKPYWINWEKLMEVTCTLAVPVEAPECYEDKETVTFREIYARVTTEGSGWEPFAVDPILVKDEKHYYMQNASKAAISLLHELLRSYRYSIRCCEPSGRLNCEGSFKPDEGPAKCVSEFEDFDVCAEP